MRTFTLHPGSSAESTWTAETMHPGCRECADDMRTAASHAIAMGARTMHWTTDRRGVHGVTVERVAR